MIRKKTFKADFHTHSIVSQDGGITFADYAHILKKEVLDVVAVTDHNEISFAQKLQQQFGKKIIVGEEISTKEGHVIGLFLQKMIVPNQSIDQTITQIKLQKGLVYIPHPFDSLRKGIGENVLRQVSDGIDMIEGFNGRVIFKIQNTKAQECATYYQKAIATGSDSHARGALGASYTLLEEIPTVKTLVSLVQKAERHEEYQNFLYYFSPKYNRLKKIFL